VLSTRSVTLQQEWLCAVHTLCYAATGVAVCCPHALLHCNRSGCVLSTRSVTLHLIACLCFSISEKMSLLSRLFRRSGRKQRGLSAPPVALATFSAQFPPAEWFNQRVVHLHSVGTQTLSSAALQHSVSVSCLLYCFTLCSSCSWSLCWALSLQLHISNCLSNCVLIHS
jgi:hypothetical protein